MDCLGCLRGPASAAARWMAAAAVALCSSACFPSYASEDDGSGAMAVELPDGPTPCGDDECSASEVCIQHGRQWVEPGCDLEEVPAFCAPRLPCDDLTGSELLSCQAEGRCWQGCNNDLRLVDGVLLCDDTPCHCPSAYDDEETG